tara:strand:+ start:240 stop:1550 length:1311 start_codon:yes stop_codon:yes gene_type:complete
MTFQIRFSGSVTINAEVPAGSYTQSNFLSAISSALNNSMFSLEASVGVSIGRQFIVDNAKGKAVISYATSVVNRSSIDSKWTKNNLTFGDSTGTYAVVDAGVIDNFNTHAISKNPITKGCGKVQFTCESLPAGGSADDTKGFILGLTAQNPKTKSSAWALADIVIGVQPTNHGHGVYIIKNGVRSGSASSTTASDDDAVAIELNMAVDPTPNARNARIVKYDSNDPATPEYPSDSSIVLGDNTDYYAIMIAVSDDDDDLLVKQPIYTPDTFFSSTVDPNLNSGIAIGRNPSYPTTTTGYLQMSATAQLTLKYTYGYYPHPSGTNEPMLAQHSWKAENVMNSTNRVDGYVVELLNLPIDSYDSFNGGQRRDILATVVAKDDSDDIVYNAGFPVWLNLNNSRRITLRNITFRIVNTDYSALESSGIPNATLLIREMRM